MAEMDPIIRDALKRSSQMQGYIPKPQHQPQTKRAAEKQNHDLPKKETTGNECVPEIKGEKRKETGLEALLKNKEQSLILLLAVLLLNEDSSPELVLALMYLLI